MRVTLWKRKLDPNNFFNPKEKNFFCRIFKNVTKRFFFLNFYFIPQSRDVGRVIPQYRDVGQLSECMDVGQVIPSIGI